ncbi:MAG: sigma-70 family RNA polymerase sigma factor [Pseudomonadota bacterium]
MTQAGWVALQQRLLLRYGELKKRLTRYLGSAELAGDALQDTWLRLERGGDLAQVRSPDTYLFRTAVNIARDNVRSDNRLVRTTDAHTLLGVVDETPDAARTVESRSNIRALAAIMAELPPRQKAILLAARLEGLSRRQIAARYGVSVRFVYRELQAAQDYCAARLTELTDSKFTFGPRESSPEQDAPRTEKTGRKAPGAKA